ncbi:MAG: hypothetical protein QW416_08735 [Candidatus Nitrosocaldaceae archaeon]
MDIIKKEEDRRSILYILTYSFILMKSITVKIGKNAVRILAIATFSMLVLSLSAIPNAYANKKLVDAGEGCIVAGTSIAAVGQIANVVPGGQKAAAIISAVGGVVSLVGAGIWGIGKIFGGDIPLHKAQAPPELVSGVDTIDPTKKFISKVPTDEEIDALVLEHDLGEEVGDFIKSNREFVAAIIGWYGTILNLHAADQMGRQDLLLEQGIFLREYAELIGFNTRAVIPAAEEMDTVLNNLLEEAGIEVTQEMVDEGKEILLEEGFSEVTVDVFKLFGLDDTAVEFLHEQISEVDPPIGASQCMNQDNILMLVDGIHEDTEFTWLVIPESPIGIIAMISIPLALLGYWRMRRDDTA